ncbi:hypothetical protein [Dyadobacter sp. NIV53]|uniref:hypothetical protein n=1 Tax=Dyadobacter sp. NIV53 TaxID=2861765 RepID=UPI001C876CFF|nr:hypothetical protein [Dyadobacter sp. NIV53]
MGHSTRFSLFIISIFLILSLIMWYLWEYGNKDQTDSYVAKWIKAILISTSSGLFFYMFAEKYNIKENMTPNMFKAIGLTLFAYGSWFLAGLGYLLLLLMLLTDYVRYKSN